MISPSLFKAYDIRGKTSLDGKSGVLNIDTAYIIGLGIADDIIALNLPKKICLGFDGRLSSPNLAAAVQQGLTDNGIEVVTLGLVPTGALYFATHSIAANGVMITGSHNPPEYNGIKIVLNQQALFGDEIQRISYHCQRYADQTCPINLVLPEINHHAWQPYVDSMLHHLPQFNSAFPIPSLSKVKVVIDGGNGVAGPTAVAAFEQLGVQVIPIYCNIDGQFPNHHPDPAVESNLAELKQRVLNEGALLGIGLDGDGDRLGVIDHKGQFISPDRIAMLFAEDIVSANPSSIIPFDVKCTSQLARIIEESGGQPRLCPTGHSILKRTAKQLNSPFAAELSGHFVFADHWYGFDCGIYAGLRWLELICRNPNALTHLNEQYPPMFSTPELHLAIEEGQSPEIMRQINQNPNLTNLSANRVDGLRLSTKDQAAWALIRPSNTTPVLTLRFEGKSQKDLESIQNLIRLALLDLFPISKLPF